MNDTIGPLKKLVTTSGSLLEKAMEELAGAGTGFFTSFGYFATILLRLSLQIAFRLYILVILQFVVVWFIPAISLLDISVRMSLYPVIAARVLGVMLIIVWVILAIRYAFIFGSMLLEKPTSVQQREMLTEPFAPNWAASQKIGIIRSIEKSVFNITNFTRQVISKVPDTGWTVIWGILFWILGAINFGAQINAYYIEALQIPDASRFPLWYTPSEIGILLIEIFDFFVITPAQSLVEFVVSVISKFEQAPEVSS